jgi:tetratricopeptide (TPR) repeat protein
MQRKTNNEHPLHPSLFHQLTKGITMKHSMRICRTWLTTMALTVVSLASFVPISYAAELDVPAMNTAIGELQHAWAKGFYKTPEIEREAALSALSARAEQVTAKYQSKLTAGGTAKAARDLLLQAEKLDATALEGSALTSLGSLYFKVPRIISFGDHDKARSYLERALKVNPDGIDPNFFYGEFLAEKGEKAKAIQHLNKALKAAPRLDRADADAGRRIEIKQLLAQLTQ